MYCRYLCYVNFLVCDTEILNQFFPGDSKQFLRTLCSNAVVRAFCSTRCRALVIINSVRANQSSVNQRENLQIRIVQTVGGFTPKKINIGIVRFRDHETCIRILSCLTEKPNPLNFQTRHKNVKFC